MAKILLLDIENTPLVSYTWGRYEQDVIAVKRHSHLLSYATQWLGEGGTRVRSLRQFKDYLKDKHSDLELCKNLHFLMSNADIIVGHNIDGFDIKKINARFAFHGLTPPATYKTVDTLKIARKHFSFDSNRLNELGKFLGLGEKIKTGGFDLWLKCMDGDAKAWGRMEKYNKRDVDLLKKIYLKLRPWAKNHPSLALINGRGKCETCGGNHLLRRGTIVSVKRKYQRFQCSQCGHWSQGEVER